jgi:hypothetical protein
MLAVADKTKSEMLTAAQKVKDNLTAVFDHAALNYVGLRGWRQLWFERFRHKGTANSPKHLSQSGHEHMAYSNFSPLGF